MQLRKGKGGEEVGIWVSVKSQQWHMLSLPSSLVLCVNSNLSRILARKMNSHMGKEKDAREQYWLLVLFSECMIWEWQSVQTLRLNFQSTAGNQSKNNWCRKVKCWERKKKIPCCLKQTFPLDSQLFPYLLKYSACGLKALSVIMLHSLESIQKEEVSVKLFDVFNHRRTLLVFSGPGL